LCQPNNFNYYWKPFGELENNKKNNWLVIQTSLIGMTPKRSGTSWETTATDNSEPQYKNMSKDDEACGCSTSKFCESSPSLSSNSSVQHHQIPLTEKTSLSSFAWQKTTNSHESTPSLSSYSDQNEEHCSTSTVNTDDQKQEMKKVR